MILQFGKQFGRAEHVSDVDIVPAGVHNADILSRIVNHLDSTRVRQARLLGNGQGIKLSAQQHRWARAIFHYGNHAVAGPFGPFILADAFGNGVAHRPQLRRKKGGSLLFVM